MLPGYDKEHTTDTQVSQQNIHPDIRGERIQEGEDSWVCTVGLAVQNTYSKCHKGLGKVDDLLSNVGNSQWSNCEVSFLQRETEKRKRKILSHKKEASNQTKTKTLHLTIVSVKITLTFKTFLTAFLCYSFLRASGLAHQDLLQV